MKTSKKNELRTALGVDFGGTSVKVGLVDERGNLLGHTQAPTGERITRTAWLDSVEACARELIGKHTQPIGIGVGVPGFTDFEKGRIINLTNVRGWTGVPLAGIISKRFKLPAWVDNDANAAALGECVFGAGRKYHQAVMVTLGTGVGGGIVLNGRVFRGAHSMAGEIGHVCIDMNGSITPEGRGGLETFVGNRRIAERAAQAIRAGRRTSITRMIRGDLTAITPKLIAEAAHKGDRLSLEIFDFVADCLAAAFASITYVLQPEVFILTGGVARSGSILFKPLKRHLKERLSPFFARQIAVKPARFAEHAGVIGCAALAFQYSAKPPPEVRRGGRIKQKKNFVR